MSGTKNWRIQFIWNTISGSWIKPSGPHQTTRRAAHVCFTRKCSAKRCYRKISTKWLCIKLCLSRNRNQGILQVGSNSLQQVEKFYVPWGGIHEQGCNDVRWRPRQEASLAAHVRTYGLSGANALYWREYLRVIWRPGNYAPLVTPLLTSDWTRRLMHGLQNKRSMTWASPSRN